MKVAVLNLSQQQNRPAGVDSLHKPARCKFVLVGTADTYWLVFGSVAEFAYHADLVDRFCTDYGIPSAWVRRPDLVEVYDKHVRICGGGWMEINGEKSAIKIGGYSRAYGRFEQGIMDLVTGNAPFFDLYRIEVAG